MRVLLSVRPSAADGRQACDLIVTAPPETTIHELADALNRAVPGPSAGALTELPRKLTVVGEQTATGPDSAPPSLWHGSNRLDPQVTLETGGIRDGMLLGLGSPAMGDEDEPDGVVELRVISGPGAGAVHRLGLGRYTIGGACADIPLEGHAEEDDLELVVFSGGRAVLSPCEDAAERMLEPAPARKRELPGPLVLGLKQEPESRRRSRRRRRRDRKQPAETVPEQTLEEQPPDTPRRFLELDRRSLEPDTIWEEGAVLTVGRTQLAIGPVPAADAVATPTPGAPTLDFNRPPRLARPTRERIFTLPRQPQPPGKPPFPLAMLLSPLVMGGGMYLLTHRPATLLFVVLSPIMMLANRIQGRSTRKRAYRDGMRQYRQQKAAAEAAAHRALLEERGLRRRDAPDPAEILLRATGPRAGLWERRPSDPDWLDLRVGTADVPSEVVLQDPARATYEEPLRWTAPDVPVTVGLGRLGVAGVAGEERHRVATWLVAQATALHSPAELDLVILADPEQAAASQPRWDWARWLPHLRNPEGAGARARVGFDEETVTRRVNELVSLIESRAEGADKDAGRASVLVVLDGARALRLVPGMVRILREGPQLGIYLLCIDRERPALPEECRAVVATGPGPAAVAETGQDEVEQVLLDLVPAGWCERVARSLAPIRDVSAAGAEGAIPTSSRFLDVVDMAEPSAQGVLQTWRRVGRTTRAVIGEDAEGLFAVDIRADGPHALVAGTTGSGKSELLQTLIASLCVGNSPDDMTFVLVDYKGGAAFKDCSRLPHTVGMVTDLDGHLTARALESLGAELRRRELQLARADAKDIEDYVAAMAPGDEPMPRLMIIIDEFAALVAELPDFVTGLVDIARRGRSLGVHLVLATQRPAGVVSAEIKSNTNLRIALRVTDEADSDDVIESGASARIPPSIPGRAYARLGHASLQQFQAARVGGRPRSAVPQAALRTGRLTLAEMSRPEPAPPQVEEDVSIPTDLATLVDAMNQAHRDTGRPNPHSPWLAPLPDNVTLDQLEDRHSAKSQADDSRPDTELREQGLLPPLILGLEDIPAEQDQRLMTWDYTRAGHLGVAGAARSGRSTLLRALAVAAARTASPQDVHLYGIDAGTGALLPLVSLPHTGAVVTRDQPDRVRRLTELLGKEVSRRQQALAMGGFASVTEQRAAAAPSERMPYLLLLLDRWDGFVASFEQVDGGLLLERMETLLREGPAAGLRVVVAGDRSIFRGRMGMMLEDRIVLRMPAPEDFELVGMRSRDVPVSMPPGRAFRSGTHPREVQLALLDADPAGTAQVAAVHREGERAQKRWGETPAARRPARVDELPLVLTDAEALALGPELGPGEFALAAGGDTLSLIPLRMDEVGNGVLVTGPRRSGKSTALCFGVATALAAGARIILVLARRSPLSAYRNHPGVVAVLDESAKAEDLRELLKTEGTSTLVVVDDYDVLGNDHALVPAFEEHVKACRDQSGGVLVASGVDELTGMYRGLMTQVKRNRTGLILAPRSPQDGDALSARLPRSIGQPVPLGRGILARPGSWTWVQVPRTGAVQ
ncbi:FtsK/SpoIIIE domain-containing protein [Actinomyces sp. MRS3W]|uniref:FtsK/SpoIIIE domain-containing protein n=1 Tax=Actinomyces sp. MRS3W TaxID=2800796 RepID=UPI0028FD0B5D|nr:FtsK/SpoIIIE domain-containing protein [Actinomyces sp. MRS3W]MDU0347727.1 FtsK/SpoIIIE domain-containing protein [Actinomyces sp. MRS3W]